MTTARYPRLALWGTLLMTLLLLAPTALYVVAPARAKGGPDCAAYCESGDDGQNGPSDPKPPKNEKPPPGNGGGEGGSGGGGKPGKSGGA